MSDNQLIYTTIFKLHNVEIESSRIELAKDVWIEANPKYAQPFPKYAFSYLMSESNSFGLSRWFQELSTSEVVIITRNTSAEMETMPLDIHECTYVAMAISILFDNWFVAGIETFFNNRDESKEHTFGPVTSMFNGKRNGKVIIKKSDEAGLKAIYDFVYSALRSSAHDNRKIKLLFLYFSCIIKSSNHSLNVLKTSFPNVFSGDFGAIIYGAIFFEHVFGKESEELQKGVREWGKAYPSKKIDFNEVEVLRKFRNLQVHDNASRSLQYVENWIKTKNLLMDDVMHKLENMLIENVKHIMREIALDYRKYEGYRNSL